MGYACPIWPAPIIPILLILIIIPKYFKSFSFELGLEQFFAKIKCNIRSDYSND